MRDDADRLPLAPDFAPHPPGPPLAAAEIDGTDLVLRWHDGLTGRFNRFWLRENEVADGVVNPVTRERDLWVEDLPEALAIAAVSIGDGAVTLDWRPDGRRTRHAPGWLRDTAERRWHPAHDLPERVSWDAAEMPEPVSFDGPPALEDEAALGAFLAAARRHGLARLRGLPPQPGLVERLARRIGTIRGSNFGFTFAVESKPDPDSNAYTTAALPPHTDLASRELQPGFQMLFCLENGCHDGHSTMVDGMRLAEVLREKAPADFAALTGLSWVFSNRHPESDYRFSGPIIVLDASGAFAEMRNTSFLRAEPDMDPGDVEAAYGAVRRLQRMARDPAFACVYPFAPGDLVMFDNRRILHGRQGFTPASGTRRLEGCYIDHDEVHSRLRVIARAAR